MDGQWWSQSPLPESRLCLETASFSTEAVKSSYSVSADVRTSACDSPRGQTLQTHCDIIQPHDCSPPCCCCCGGAAAQPCSPQFFLPLLMITSPLTWWSITSDWWKLKWLHTKAQLLLLFQAATFCALIYPTCLWNQTDGFRPGKMSKYPKCFETGAALSLICSNKISPTLSELRTRKPSSPNLQSTIKRRAEDVENHLGRRPLKRLCKQPPASTCSSKFKPMTETTDHLLI